MKDVRLANGDVFIDPTGSAQLIEGDSARVQSVLIRIGAKKGSFIYNRNLGSEYRPDMDAAEAEMVINEALAGDGGCYVSVLESGDTLRVGIPTEDGVTEQEVRFYGQL